MKKIKIPVPTKAIVRSYLKKWNSLGKYVPQEKVLGLLFKKYPKNKKIEHILIKVSLLNDFYGLQIRDTFAVAKHILKLNIDKDLHAHNEKLVHKIALVTMSTGKKINFYSFASKYCSHHQPESYPIFDYYVEKMLMHFKRTKKFYLFTKKDLHTYPKFKNILKEFRQYFRLEKYSFKKMDKYLWQAGKKHFPRKY